MRFLTLLLLLPSIVSAAESAFTREYRLKHNDAPVVIQVLKFASKDTSKKRIISGFGRKLVVTDVSEKQDEIASLLPVIDQPPKETEPRRIQMEMIVRVTNYLNKEAKRTSTPPSTAQATAQDSAGTSGASGTFDIRKSTTAYKSIYTDEDEKISKKPRLFKEDPPLPSAANLTLKGIFLISSKSPMALMTYERENFTARNGHLYHNNKTRIKGVTTRVLKDRVIVTGPDRIPREVQFRSTVR